MTAPHAQPGGLGIPEMGKEGKRVGGASSRTKKERCAFWSAHLSEHSKAEHVPSQT